jgi:hypothetical protein
MADRMFPAARVLSALVSVVVDGDTVAVDADVVEHFYSDLRMNTGRNDVVYCFSDIYLFVYYYYYYLKEILFR